MPLTLQIVSDHNYTLTTPRKTFHETGGTIGRGGCDWVIQDPNRGISKEHAIIQYENGSYIIQDTSSNGLYINNAPTALGRARKHPLKDGDLLQMGNFSIRASIPTRRNKDSPARLLEQEITPGLREDVDPLRILRDDEQIVPDVYKKSPATTVNAPDIATHKAIPENWDAPGDIEPASPTKQLTDPVVETPQPSPVIPRPVKPPSLETRLDHGRTDDAIRSTEESSREREIVARDKPGSPSKPIGSPKVDSVNVMASFLIGVGIDPALAVNQTPEQLGEIFRAVTKGVQEALKTRNEFRNQFRLSKTMVQQKDNNPLKFSVNTDDAIYNLLVKKGLGYLEPVAAFDDAFADLHGHQYAMLKAMRAAYNHMLRVFDPQALEQKLECENRGPLSRMLKKNTFLERYHRYYQSLMKDSVESYDTLFGDAFSDAYEEEVNVQRRKKAEKN